MTARTIRPRSVLLLVCLAAAAVASLSAGQGAPPSTPPPQTSQSPQSAQSPQTGQPPVFRAGATYVNVDAYPRDKDGKVIAGLSAADFQVFEDGKPQAVENFEFIRVAPTQVDDERRDPTSVAESLRQAADPHNRLFVVYLDFYHTAVSGSHDIRQPTIDFLTRTIGPTDLFGVLTPEMPVGGLTFARRVDTLEEELSKYWAWGVADSKVTPRTAGEQLLQDCGVPFLISRLRDDVFFSSLETLIGRLGALRDERKSVLLLTGVWNLRQDNPAINNLQKGGLPTIGAGPGGVGIGGVGQNQGAFDQTRCNSEISRLANLDFEQRFRDLIGKAKRGNVSFYPIDTAGLRTVVSIKQLGELQSLAENTDGRAIVNTNDLHGSLKTIADDVSAYYLLGYYSTNTAQDGRFRSIEVKLKTGAKVTARNGYLAPTAAMTRAADAAAARAAATPTAVDDELGRLSKLREDAKVFGYGAASSSGLDVVTEIAGREIEAGRWRTGGDIKLTLTNAAGTKTATGKIDAGARGAVIHVPASDAGVGPWTILTQVSGSDGRLDETFDVPAPSASPLGRVQYFRATPSPRSPLRPVADMQFRRTERLHLEWQLIGALDNRTARLLSRRGDALPLPVNLTERTDGEHPVLAADLQLAPLSEGDYLVELTAGQGADSTKVLVPFRLIR